MKSVISITDLNDNFMLEASQNQ